MWINQRLGRDRLAFCDLVNWEITRSHTKRFSRQPRGMQGLCNRHVRRYHIRDGAPSYLLYWANDPHNCIALGTDPPKLGGACHPVGVRSPFWLFT